MSRWFVVGTLPRQETRAEINLRRQGYDAWLPSMPRMRRHARRRDVVLAPLFPGYLFVALDLTKQAWSPINGTYGVKGLVCNNGVPARLPNGFVENLRTDIERGDFLFPEDRLVPGNRVRILDGPFSELVGTLMSLSSRERVTLLLDVLGREISIVMSRESVAPVM